jgi:hypothetical protein
VETSTPVRQAPARDLQRCPLTLFRHPQPPPPGPTREWAGPEKPLRGKPIAPAHTNPVRATWRPAHPLMFGDSKRPLGAVALPGHPALTVPRSPRRLSTGPISATRATAQPPGTHGRTTAYAPKAPRGVGSYTACVTTCVLFASSPCACHQPPRAQWTQRRLSRELCGACCARPGAHDCTLCVATPRLGHQLDVWTTAADSSTPLVSCVVALGTSTVHGQAAQRAAPTPLCTC